MTNSSLQEYLDTTGFAAESPGDGEYHKNPAAEEPYEHWYLEIPEKNRDVVHRIWLIIEPDVSADDMKLSYVRYSEVTNGETWDKQKLYGEIDHQWLGEQVCQELQSQIKMYNKEAAHLVIVKGTQQQVVGILKGIVPIASSSEGE